jgi:hypothetical protein
LHFLLFAALRRANFFSHFRRSPEIFGSEFRRLAEGELEQRPRRRLFGFAVPKMSIGEVQKHAPIFTVHRVFSGADVIP